MVALHRFVAGQVCDGAADAQGAGEAARREAEFCAGHFGE
jgi:hypothetical protein